MCTPRRAVALALLALLLALLAACGGAQPPATMAGIPVYPEAAELQPGENELVDTIAASMGSTGGAELSAEMRRYSLPPGTSWEQVEAYFSEQLSGTDWQPTAELGGASAALSTAGWQRGGAAAEQVLLVGLLPEEVAETPVLIVSLFSE